MSTTIFDSPWFFLERPAFRKIAAWSDRTLSALLILCAVAIVVLALQRGRPLLKAVALAYITLP